VSTGHPFVYPNEGTVQMIVIGADTHKRSHTVGAVDAANGRVIADRTVRAQRRSFEDLLLWARGLGGERVWAIEDCRHVSGALERFLLARGERIVRRMNTATTIALFPITENESRTSTASASRTAASVPAPV
jgi:hypothetical protein